MLFVSALRVDRAVKLNWNLRKRVLRRCDNCNQLNNKKNLFYSNQSRECIWTCKTVLLELSNPPVLICRTPRSLSKQFHLQMTMLMKRIIGLATWRCWTRTQAKLPISTRARLRWISNTSLTKKTTPVETHTATRWHPHSWTVIPLSTTWPRACVAFNKMTSASAGAPTWIVKPNCRGSANRTSNTSLLPQIRRNLRSHRKKTSWSLKMISMRSKAL